MTEIELNQYVDNDLTPAERLRAERHLADCAECRAILVDLHTISLLMTGLPHAPTPRSFQLDPEYARTQRPRWRTWGAGLIPLLPALRAATVAVTLAFGSVTAYRIVDEPPESGRLAEQAMDAPATTGRTDVALTERTRTPIAPALTSGAAADTAQKAPAPTDSASGATDMAAPQDNAAEESAGAPAPGSDDEAQPAQDDSSVDAAAGSNRSVDETPADAEDADVNIPMIAMEIASPVASPTSEPTATPTATATSSPASTPVAGTPTPVADAQRFRIDNVGENDDEWTGWTQLLLGSMLFGLLILTAGAVLARGPTRR